METALIDGFIYTVRSKSRPELVYYGSTVQRLSQRMAGHRAEYNDKTKAGHCTSMQILALGDAYIELVEAVRVPSKQHLKAIEGRYQRENDCVNLYVAGRLTAEYRQIPEVKAHRQAYQKAFQQTTGFKEMTPIYRERGKAAAAAHRKTPEVRAHNAALRATPEAKAKQHARYEARKAKAAL